MDRALRDARNSYLLTESMVSEFALAGYKAPIDADELRKRCGEILMHSKRLIAMLTRLHPIFARYRVRLEPDACNTGMVSDCHSFGYQATGLSTCLFVALSPITPFRHQVVIGLLDSLDGRMLDAELVYNAVSDTWQAQGKHYLVRKLGDKSRAQPLKTDAALRLVECLVALSASEQPAAPAKPAGAKLH